MTDLLKIIVAGVAGALIFFAGGMSNSQPAGAPVTKTNFDALDVKEFEQGGGVLTLSDAASITLTEDNMEDNSVFVLAASTTAGTYTLTLPATSTVERIIEDPGDSRVWFFKNENTTAATTTTLAAGTGIVLDEPDGQNVVIGGGNRARIECYRDDNTDIICSVDEHIDAD